MRGLLGYLILMENLYNRKILLYKFNNAQKFAFSNFARELRRELQNVLISAKVINVCFCSDHFLNNILKIDEKQNSIFVCHYSSIIGGIKFSIAFLNLGW